MDSYFALAAFVLFAATASLVLLVVILLRQNERLEEQAAYDAETIRFLKSEISPFDHDGDGRPGGRKRHDPYIDR